MKKKRSDNHLKRGMILLDLSASLVFIRHWKEASIIVREIAINYKEFEINDLFYLEAYNHLKA